MTLPQYILVLAVLALTLMVGWGGLASGAPGAPTPPAPGSRAEARLRPVRAPEVRWSDPRVRALYRLAKCETGYLAGGRPNWRHHNGTYTGALGFAHSTWAHYKQKVRPVPRARYAADARPVEQYAVGLVLIETFHGYSSWPACSVRLGLR